MTKWEAQDAFWNSFGLPAYDENSSLTDEKDESIIPDYNHITYQSMAGVMNQILPVNASLWYMSNSWRDISEKADEIAKAVGFGVIVKIDGGYFWFKMPDATPFAQRLDSGNDSVKRILITIEAECLTKD